MDDMTLCLWIFANNSSPVFLSMAIKSTRGRDRSITLNFKRNKYVEWVHICISLRFSSEELRTFINGVRVPNSDEFKSEKSQRETLQDAMITITFESNVTNTLVKFSRLNIWDGILAEHKIMYLSYECRQENGTILKWNEYVANAFATLNQSLNQYKSTCIGKQGNVLSVKQLSRGASNVAEFTSPRYERSSKSPGRCLKFRYQLWGPGARAIKIYQELLEDKKFPRRLVWIDDGNGTRVWREGEVTLAAVMEYKLIIVGESTDQPALISIGALHTTKGYCNIVPRVAAKACNEILRNSTGYIISPYYPGYYTNNLNCTWTIKAEKGHMIQMELKTFELEMSSLCSADFLEVYDGESTANSRIGRYCGIRYPPIIQSTVNALIVMFVTNNDIVRSGFFGKYRIIKDTRDPRCIHDCPDDCECQRSEHHNKGIIVSSKQLTAVPDQLPKQTIAVLFSDSDIFQVESEAFSKLKHLFFIDLSFNEILEIEKRSFVDLPALQGLRLNRNFLRSVDSTMFDGLHKLDSLDFGENLILYVEENTFWNLTNLQVLSLRSNIIQELSRSTFEKNKRLIHLYLQDNALKRLPAGIFRQQKHLKVLNLHSNKLVKFDKSNFEGLRELETLTLDNNSVVESSVPQNAFDSLVSLKYLTLDSFILCCYAKKSLPDLTNCRSPGNSFSSCDNMLKSVVIQAAVWIQGFFATFGNLAVIGWWAIYGKEKSKTRQGKGKARIQSLLLSNLAFADLLMGIYLLFVAVQHTLWKGEYFKHDVEWRSGIPCQIAGGIATLSSEVSVMILVAITADRVSSILFEFSGISLNKKFARNICIVIWTIGFIISFIPLLIPGYFFDQVSGFSFYGRSTVCLPLQLSKNRPAGWEYSIAMFNAFNGAAFIFIVVAYTAIFVKVQRSAKRVRSSRGSGSSLGKRLIFIILTDFFCWMPVVVIGLLSLTGNFHDPTGQVYAWVAVLILPINSSINPILYTFSTTQVIKKFSSIRKSGQSKQSQKEDRQSRETNNQHDVERIKKHRVLNIEEQQSMLHPEKDEVKEAGKQKISRSPQQNEEGKQIKMQVFTPEFDTDEQIISSTPRQLTVKCTVHGDADTSIETKL